MSVDTSVDGVDGVEGVSSVCRECVESVEPGLKLKQFEMMAIADASADSAAHSARATPGARSRRPSGAGALGLRWVAPACCSERAAGPSPQWVVPQS